MNHCYHCGEAIGINCKIFRQIDGAERPMCCEGCAIVASVIHESGLAEFYNKRTSLPQPVDASRQSNPLALPELFDDEIIQAQFLNEQSDGILEAQFVVDNMHCPACVWLIENQLNQLQGVRAANVNFSLLKLTVQWRKTEIELSQIVGSVQSLGYKVAPYSQSTVSRSINQKYRDLLKRMGVAGAFGMQVMVIAVVLYASAWSGNQLEFESLFHKTSLVLILPVLLYSAAPMFLGALRDLRMRTATMDVPIAFGLSIAFISSAVATFAENGEVYFDSIAMFVFFQLAARVFEHSAYRRMTQKVIALSAISPVYANRLSELNDADSADIIPAVRLKVGDYVQIKPEETIPADGWVVQGNSDVDESFLTGESAALPRGCGDLVIAGSQNLTNELVVEVVRVGSETVLESILQSLEEGVSTKPSPVRLTDRIAGIFSAGVVLLAAIVAVFWLLLGSEAWITHTISVLIVACPCALALAVPTALTTAVNAMAQLGILFTRPDAVQALSEADAFLFDKTGTLTEGQAALRTVELYEDSSKKAIMNIAGSLAQHSRHPIAQGLVRVCESHNFSAATSVEVKPGFGIRGEIDGETYLLGSKIYLKSKNADYKFETVSETPGLVTYLASDDSLIAVFRFDDSLRDGAKRLVSNLKDQGVRVELVSGDRREEVQRIAAETGIREVNWDCSPKDKLQIIREYQKQGQCVAMFGDGINDAPTLAAANVSIAPTNALDVVKTASDVLLLTNHLRMITLARETAQATVRIMRNNATWAVSYNLIGIALAAAGYVPPLAAAIGMSISSLLVVCNSLRIGRISAAKSADAAQS